MEGRLNPRPLPDRSRSSGAAASEPCTGPATSGCSAPWRSRLLAPGPAAAERVLREAQAAARLNHPSIVTLYELGEDDDGDLPGLGAGRRRDPAGARGGRGALGPRRGRVAAVELCEALAHAHERGVVHRDVKPENIAVARSGRCPLGPWGRAATGRAMLMDFGVASLAGEARITRTGEVVGTLAYMAPEQAEGEDGRPGGRRLLASRWSSTRHGAAPTRWHGRRPAATARAIGTPVVPARERAPGPAVRARGHGRLLPGAGPRAAPHRARARRASLPARRRFWIPLAPGADRPRVRAGSPLRSVARARSDRRPGRARVRPRHACLGGRKARAGGRARRSGPARSAPLRQGSRMARPARGAVPRPGRPGAALPGAGRLGREPPPLCRSRAARMVLARRRRGGARRIPALRRDRPRRRRAGRSRRRLRRRTCSCRCWRPPRWRWPPSWTAAAALLGAAARLAQPRRSGRGRARLGRGARRHAPVLAGGAPDPATAGLVAALAVDPRAAVWLRSTTPERPRARPTTAAMARGTA